MCRTKYAICYEEIWRQRTFISVVRPSSVSANTYKKLGSLLRVDQLACADWVELLELCGLLLVVAFDVSMEAMRCSSGGPRIPCRRLAMASNFDSAIHAAMEWQKKHDSDYMTGCKCVYVIPVLSCSSAPVLDFCSLSEIKWKQVIGDRKGVILVVFTFIAQLEQTSKFVVALKVIQCLFKILLSSK